MAKNPHFAHKLGLEIPVPQRGKAIRTKSEVGFLWAAGAALVLTVLLASSSAQAQTFNTLYNFTGSSDGGFPLDGVTMDTSGNLYGTTEIRYLGAGRSSCAEWKEKFFAHVSLQNQGAKLGCWARATAPDYTNSSSLEHNLNSIGTGASDE